MDHDQLNPVLNQPTFESATQTVRAKCPVIIVGSPRSGTTLMNHMLLSSGGFAVYERESHVFSGLGTRVGSLSKPANRQKLIQMWLQSKYFKNSELTADELDNVKQLILKDCRNVGDFLRIVMEAVARKQTADRWAEHTPDHVFYLQEIKRTIPDAIFIHMIRDGRDVALSLNPTGWVQTFPWDSKRGLLVCGMYWQWMVEAGISAGATLGSDYMQVHFEDLIQRPEETLARVSRFIDYDLDYERIQRVGIGSVRKPNTSFRGSGGNGFNPIGRWEKGYPPGELGVFEALVGTTLEKLGYALATPRSELPRGLEIARLHATYTHYFSTRLWLKRNAPFAKYFVRDR